MCLQEILKQNADFDSFRKKLINESKYFPEITIKVQSDNCAGACTIVRKKQDGIWYKFPVISLYYTSSPITSTEDWSFIILKNIKEAYKAMILTQILDKIVDGNGDPVFIKDDLQLDEDQIIIMETEVLRNNILGHD